MERLTVYSLNHSSMWSWDFILCKAFYLKTVWELQIGLAISQLVLKVLNESLLHISLTFTIQAQELPFTYPADPEEERSRCPQHQGHVHHLQIQDRLQHLHDLYHFCLMHATLSQHQECTLL